MPAPGVLDIELMLRRLHRTAREAYARQHSVGDQVQARFRGSASDDDEADVV